jgi:hypothetical protein
MKVICPQCNFSQEIPDDKIPDNARLATCPKCQNKFYFRELEDTRDSADDNYGYQTVDNYNDPDESSANSQRNPEIDNIQQTDNGSQGIEDNDFQEPYNSDENETAHQDEAARSDLEKRLEKEISDNTELGDLWQKLNRMAPKQDDDQEEEIEELYEDYFFEDIPFETNEKYSFFQAVGLTVKRILTKPAQFFKNMPLNGYMKPLVFFLILAEFQAVFEFFWETIVGLGGTTMQDINTTVGTGISQSMASGSGEVLISLLLFPILITLISFPTAGITHVMLMVFGSGKKGFEATYRATTYSYAAAIFSVIPIAGPFIASALSMALSVIAYKNIHESSYTRVIMAMLAPTVVLLILALIYYRLNQPTI